MRKGSDTPNRRLTHWRRFLKREAQRVRARPASAPERNLRLSLFEPEILSAAPKGPFDWRDFERRALFFAQFPESDLQTFDGRQARERQALVFFAELFSELCNPQSSLRLSALVARSASVSERVDFATGEARPIRPLTAISALFEPFSPRDKSDSWSPRANSLRHALAEGLAREPQGRLLHFWRDVCLMVEGAPPAPGEEHPRQELLHLMSALAGNEAFRTALLLPSERELEERQEPLAISGLHEAIPALARAAVSAPWQCVQMAKALFERADRLGLLPAAPTRRFLSGQLRETSLAHRVVEALIIVERRGPQASSEAVDRAQDAFAQLLWRYGAEFLPHEIDRELGNPLSARAQSFSAALRSFKEARSIQEAMGDEGLGAKAASRSRL